jgi:AraC-like DNA-binding protein
MTTDVKSRSVTERPRTEAPDAEAPAQLRCGIQAAPLKWVAEVEPSELFAFRDCQDLLRTRLSEPLLKLITQLTGLRLHVFWHRPLDFHGNGEMPVPCPIARQRASDAIPRPQCCQSCLQHRWKPASSPTNQGRRFTGECGITNFCAGLQVENVCALTLVLQAKIASRFSSAQEFSGGDRFWTEHAGKCVSSAAFHRAVAFVCLIVHDLQSTAEARTASSGLDSALRRLNNTEAEAARLRGELRHRLPGLPESTLQPGLGSRAQKIVEAMFDYVHEHYSRPINLDEVASAMKKNASYLSALFSQTTGVTFHHFLEEVRLSKAKELLRDPRNRIRKVAGATGYASLDAFRHAFKVHEGLSPAAWRTGQ